MKAIRKQTIGKLCLGLIPVIVIVASLLIYASLPKSNSISIEGSVEIATTPCFSLVSGPISIQMAETGQTVKAGDVLAVIENKTLDNDIAQLQATLTMKNAKLKQLRKGSSTASVDAARKAAQSTVSIYEEKSKSAARALTQAQEELALQTTLYESGVASKAEVDRCQRAVEDAQSAIAVAQAETENARHQVNTFTSTGVSGNDIEAAQADIHLTELQIERLQASKEDYTIKALRDGVVLGRNVEPGAYVTAGQALFDLSIEKQQYFVCYLPQESVQSMQFGDRLTLYPLNSDQPLAEASICFIDWKAVYTPKELESSANKNKRSIKVKALIEHEQPLRVGETLVIKLGQDAGN